RIRNRDLVHLHLGPVSLYLGLGCPFVAHCFSLLRSSLVPRWYIGHAAPSAASVTPRMSNRRHTHVPSRRNLGAAHSSFLPRQVAGDKTARATAFFHPLRAFAVPGRFF